MFLPFVENAWRTVSAIDVKPELKFSCDSRKFWKRINHAGVNSPGTADDTKRPQAFATIGFDFSRRDLNACAVAHHME